MSMTRGAKMLMVRNESNRARNEGGGRNEMRNEMRYEGGSGGRNGYGEMNYPQNEYGGMNYGESRFRDRRGREHYDNGRFAPMNEMDGEMRGARNEMRGEDMRSEEMRGNYRGQSHYPFGPVPPIYEREGPMNRIGFAAEPRREMESNYPMDANYPRMTEMGHRTSEMTMGHAKGGGMMLTEDMAHEWMEGLHNEDGTKGAHWTMDQVKQVMSQRGVKMDPLEFWVVLNIMYSDYCGVLKKHGANNMDVYVDMAKAWLDDKDAMDGKAARYFQYIVK